MRHDAATISRMLAHRAADLVRELLPGGKRSGGEWRCGSIAGEPGESCSVKLQGSRAGVWADFATGECGDALDLVAACLYAGDRGRALRWSAKFLGLGDDAAPATSRPAAPARDQDHDKDDREKRRKAALAIFLEAQERLFDTPADLYLLGRGIDLRKLAGQPRALRYHPSLYNGETKAKLPAMVAAVSGMDGSHVATHRTWLQRFADGTWRKAKLASPKMTLGSPDGGTIRLQRGASRRPPRGAVDGESVVIGEGIETCLSIAVACPEMRVLSAVSLANMGRVALPDVMLNVIIAADNDAGNDAARRGLQRAVHHFLAGGHVVRMARSPIGGDFNDALMACEACA